MEKQKRVASDSVTILKEGTGYLNLGMNDHCRKMLLHVMLAPKIVHLRTRTLFTSYAELAPILDGNQSTVAKALHTLNESQALKVDKNSDATALYITIGSALQGEITTESKSASLFEGYKKEEDAITRIYDKWKVICCPQNVTPQKLTRKMVIAIGKEIKDGLTVAHADTWFHNIKKVTSGEGFVGRWNLEQVMKFPTSKMNNWRNIDAKGDILAPASNKFDYEGFAKGFL